MLPERAKPSKKQAAIAVVVLVIASTVAIAASGIFTSGSTFQTDSGLSVQVGEDQPLSGNPFADARSLAADGGRVSAQSDGDGFVRVDRWADSSGKTRVSNISLENLTARFSPDTGDDLGIQGAAGEVRWKELTAESDGSDVVVTGSGGSVNITVYGLEPQQSYEMVDDGEAVLSTADDDGTAVFDLSDGSYAFQAFENDLPSVTNPDPDGDVVKDSVTLSADIDDDTLPGNDVNVTFRVDGEAVHETSISSAQRVNYTLTQSELPGAGYHDWSITATDSLGASQTTSSTFGINGYITVRNVSNPDESIPGATATVYTDGGEVDLQANETGVISTAGLPAGERLVMTVNAEGYRQRTTIIPSIVQASDAYLLQENVTAVENQFTLTDPTGEFDSDSVVYIERPLNQTNASTWQVVAADEFGVEGFTTFLEEDQRYRLRIVSSDGDVAQMGKYTAERATTIPLRPQSPAVNIVDGETLGYAANVTDGELTVQYRDPTNQTEVLTIYAVSRFNDSDYLLEPETYYGANELVINEPVGELQDSYVVVIEGQRDGESFTIRQPVGPDQISLVPGGLSEVWLQIGSIGLLLMVGGVFSRLNVGIGAITTSLLGGIMWYIGLLSGVATWGSVAVAIMFSVVYAMVIQE